MLKAIILDFNGVILDDEPLHFAAMRETVAHFGVDLTKDVYWARYLPFDDRQCLEAICRDFSLTLGAEEVSRTLARKAGIYRQLISKNFRLFPGAVEFIQMTAARYPLALASGARRDEIESTLESTSLRSYFVIIVAAEDFVRGKPHPESFLLALEGLNRVLNGTLIKPSECLVVEDSASGVQGAVAAGMKCLAVTNSYSPDKLGAASKIVGSLKEVQLNSLQTLFEATE